MAKASLHLLGPGACQRGLPAVQLTPEEQLQLERFAAGYEDIRTLKATDLPDWFVQKMREKNPAQAFASKLPFKLNGFTHYGVLDDENQPLQNERARKRVLANAIVIANAPKLAKEEKVRELAEKVKEKMPLTEDEQKVVDMTSRGAITRQERKDYVEDIKERVEKMKAPVPKSAREMRVEVERLCQQYKYSPIEALLKIATEPPTDDAGNSLLPISEIIAIHKMLLPYVAPQMSSVRVADTSGGSLLVKVQQFNFVPAAPGQQALAPVADKDNNDIGDAWRQTTGRKTALDMMVAGKYPTVDGKSKEVRDTGLTVVPPPIQATPRPNAPGPGGIGKDEVYERDPQ